MGELLKFKYRLESPLIVFNACYFPGFDHCTMIMLDVKIKGDWFKDMEELSVLFLQFLFVNLKLF